jgi:hypothetical protein
MKDKYYYTPTIEEFHVGFDYEWLRNTEWINFNIYNHIELMAILKAYREGKFEGIRVKYLDQSDIESLGWVNGETHGVSGLVFNYGDKNDNWQIYPNYDVQFYAIYSITGIIFQGFIKNKSELKKLMQQLDIK